MSKVHYGVIRVEARNDGGERVVVDIACGIKESTEFDHTDKRQDVTCKRCLLQIDKDKGAE